MSVAAPPLSLMPVAVIPVYNHGATLRDVVQRTLLFCPQVVVVNDGSTDGGDGGHNSLKVDGATDRGANWLPDLPITLITLPRNGGKGAALMAGAEAARKLGATHIITLDADGQHYPEDIPLFLEALHRTPHAILVGCRDFNTPHVPKSSRFGRAFSGFWMRVQTGLAVGDMQSGFRAYPLHVLACLDLDETGYAFEVEVLVRAAWAGFEICDIPVRVIYPPADERISHFHALRDNARISLLNTRLTVRALIPIPFKRHALHAEGRISLRRPLQSLRQLLRDPVHRANPTTLALSAGVAVAVSTLPLPGLQSIVLLLCVGWWRLNRLCALAMIPLTWPPFVPGLAVLLGYRLRHGEWLTEFSVRTLGHEWGQRLLEWVLGSVALAPLLGLAAAVMVGLTATCVRSGLGVMENTKAGHWSSRSLGSRLQHQIFFQLARWRLMPLARGLLWVVVFYYTLLPWVRRRCMPYVQRRFGVTQGWKAFTHAFRLYRSFGEVLLDRTVAAATGNFAITSHMNDARRLLCEVLERKQGCIVLSAHVGAWQMGMAALEVVDVPVNLLQWRDPQDVDRHYFEAGKGRAAHIIDASRPMEAMVQTAAALRRGEILAIMGDRLMAHGNEHGSAFVKARGETQSEARGEARGEARVEVPFLHGHIALPIKAYALASITGAPLVMVLTVREKDKTQPFLSQEIFVPRGLNHRDPHVFLPYAAEFAKAMEALTKAHPYQFFNFYNIWLDEHAN